MARTLHLLCHVVFGCLLLAHPALAAQKPNIVFILADDLGWADTSVYGSKYYETPNIDQLAAQGLKLTNYHNSQNCQPSRAALISGQYAPRTGVYTVGGIGRFNWHNRPLRPVQNVHALPLDKITIAQALKKAGYTTGMFGKWHLGEEPAQHPGQRGFDEAITISMDGHFNFTTNPKTEYPKGQYDADFLTDKAVDFIQRHKDKAAPFFLFLPHFVVHAPHQAKPDLQARFKPKPAVGGQKSPVYAGMIASLDESVGRVMNTLQDLSLSENTVLIFSSDNGGVGGYERESLGITDITDNAPLRNGKGSLYEGGTRDPFIIRWPGKIPAGKTCDVPSIHVDLYPTLLEIAGAEKPANYPLDGESLLPWFFKPDLKRNHAPIYQHFPGYLGANPKLDTWRTTPVGTIQEGDWKLMEFFEDGHLELYHLKEDLGETRNLAATNPAKANALHSQMLAWRRTIHAPMPAPNDKKGPVAVPSSSNILSE